MRQRLLRANVDHSLRVLKQQFEFENTKLRRERFPVAMGGPLVAESLGKGAVIHLSSRHTRVPYGLLLTVAVLAATCGSLGASGVSAAVPPAPQDVAVGEDLNLVPAVRNTAGRAIASPAMHWRSSDSLVATVNPDGLVTDVFHGTATIAATVGSSQKHPDRTALVALYEATNGDNWENNTNWLTDAPLGDWYGVETHNRLSGTIPSDLAKIFNTYRYERDMHGPGLDLGSNELTGSIPAELDTANLIYLNLSDNKLHGPIPPELGNLPANSLDFSRNRFGPLSEVDLSDNRLAGPVPESFLQLTSRALNLSGNEGLCGPATSRSMEWISQTNFILTPCAVALEPDDYKLREGTWYETSSALDENTYFGLGIDNADRHGFRYRLAERIVPYGRNAVQSEYQQALFGGPQHGTNPATDHVFVLSVDPAADQYARVIDVTGNDTGHWRNLAESRFVSNGSIYRAGFDCDKATTPVEIAICKNELLALGDLEMNMLFSELMTDVAPGQDTPLRVSQRDFLRQRDSECQENSDVDITCVARLYADRLVFLRRLGNPSLGDGPRFDAEYVEALLKRGIDLRRNTDARLAMYPLEMRVGETGETVDWQVDESGVLFEQTYVDTKTVWPVSVNVRYSDMLFVGSEGTVWAAAHMVPANFVQWLRLRRNQVETWRLESEAGRDFLTVWGESDEDPPALVRAWLDQHPVPE